MRGTGDLMIIITPHVADFDRDECSNAAAAVSCPVCCTATRPCLQRRKTAVTDHCVTVQVCQVYNATANTSHRRDEKLHRRKQICGSGNTSTLCLPHINDIYKVF